MGEISAPALTAGTTAGLILLGTLAQAEAAPFTVTNTNDSGAGSLRQAILDANASAGGDTINFGPGGTGTITLTGATLEITGETTIVGPGASTLTISGNDALRPFTVASSADVTISGMRIAEGRLEGGNASVGSAGAGDGGDGSGAVDGSEGPDATGGDAIAGDVRGGAISNLGELLLDRVVVTDNHGIAGNGVGVAEADAGDGGNAGNAGGDGGDGGDAASGSGNGGNVLGAAIYNGGAMTIRSSTVSGNTATAGDGADADAAGGGGGAGGPPPSMIEVGGDGGAGGAATATGVRGGDVRGAGVHNAGTLVVEGSTVSGNTAAAGDAGDATAVGGGGGDGVAGPGGGSGGDGGSATATAGRGGRALGAGIHNTGTLELRNSTVSGNVALPGADGTTTPTGGAGGSNRGGDGGDASTTSVGGIARGGGIDSVTGAGETATVRSATIAGNAAASGANLNGAGVLSVGSSIVSDPQGGGPSCAGTVGSAGYNIDSATSCGFTQATDLQSTDPQIGLLQDNGGPTATHALVKSSPGVDRGNGAGLTTDQRGSQRPSNFAEASDAPGGDGSDVGAFELEAPPTPPAPPGGPGPPGGGPPSQPPGSPLTVEVEAKRKQPGEKLRAFVTCSKDCEVALRGKGRADGEKFKTKRASRELEGGVTARLKLKLKPGDRDEVEGERGKAKLTVAASAGNETATDKAKVKLMS